MYETFYGLRERPFDLTPDPRFLLMTAGHREALTTIQYGISGRKGITLLVGVAGTGKTTLIQAALARQKGQNARALYLTNPTLTRDEFFQFLALELGLSTAAARSKTHLLRELDAALKRRRAGGALTALVIDEAQAMPDELLEEVRLLANTETTTDKLLPVVLVGQIELAERLNQRGLQQLKQRVALRSTLAALSSSETATYMAERIRIAGGDLRTVFEPEAVAAVYACSGGIPRTISVVCDNALVSGFALDQRPVRRNVIAEVARDFDLPLTHTLAATAAGTAALAVAGPLVPPAGVAVAGARPLAAVPAPAKAVVAAASPASLIATRPAQASGRPALSLLTPDEDRHGAAAKPEPRRRFFNLFARTASR